MPNYIDHLQSLSQKQLMVLLARQRQEQTQGIAVSGMACRFPGGIDSAEAFWTALSAGRVVPGESSGPPRDSLGRSRWDSTASDLGPLAATLAAGTYLSGVDLFDAGFFGLDDDEAVHLDPQQRLLLEVTVQALADANLTLETLRRGRVGVYVGISTAEYNFAGLRNGLGKDDLSPYMGTGTALSAASGRIAYTLGVRGPTLTIDTACSSMLTATHLATAALRTGECDVALVGVAHLLLSPFTSEVFAKAGMVSVSGRCRPFTASADGYVRGEGVGVVVLERYADAARVGRQPYAVIRGSAVHQHGDRPSFAMASAASQRAAIDMALERSGVRPHDVQYVEAQANGSRLGGVIEAEVLAESYRRYEAGAPPLFIGSCKANLGYLETASGAASLMKTVLALEHGEIPPQPGADDLDPDGPWDRAALRLPTTAVPWPGAGRRIAGVSAVGFTGTATHVVLEAAPPAHARVDGRPAGPALLVLSAHSGPALAATADRLRAFCARTGGWEYRSVCRSLLEGREQLPHRYAAVVGGPEDLFLALARAAAGDFDVSTGDQGLFIDLRPAGSSPQTFPALAEHLDEVGPAPRATAWLRLLRAVGLTVDGVLLDPAAPESLVAEVTGVSDGSPTAKWQHTATVDRVELRRAGATTRSWTPLWDMAEDGWYAVLARAFTAGTRLAPDTAGPRPRPALCRLPGPAFVRRRHWADINTWR